MIELAVKALNNKNERANQSDKSDGALFLQLVI